MSRPSAPLDTLWQAPSLIWVLIVGEALAIVLALAPGVEGSRWVALGLYSLAVQWTTLTTLGAVYLLRRTLRTLPAAITATVVIAVLVPCALAVASLGRMVFFPTMHQGEPITGLLWRTALIALPGGLLGLAAFHNYWRARESATRAKQAELEALQARVHPHFLFNTLNSAAALVHARPDDAERVLLDLSDLFRAALSEPGWVPLQHELDLCRRYLAIEQLRFGDRLKVEWHLGEDLDALHVPLLAVQPLVENAVAHGLDDTDHGRRVRIDVMQAGGALHVSVANAIAKTPLSRAGGHGIGLAAVRARIEAVTQGRGRLEAGEKGGDFVARLLIPRDPMPGSGQATIS
jgi:two-component system sensor histidine kinase AlgZ